MTGKWLTLLNVLLLITALFLGINLAYQLTFLLYQKSLSREAALPPVGGNQSLFEHRPDIDQHPVNIGRGKTAQPEKIDSTIPEKHDLELKLLGTVTTDSGKRFAVIEETADGQQQLYREGSRIQGAVIHNILRSKVVLLVNGSKVILEAEKGRQIAEIREPEFDNNNEARQTPLMEAVNQGRRGKIALLLAQGEDVNARDAYGNTALILAARSGRSDIVRLLIDNGADVNQKDNVGTTPLIDSARYPSESALNVIEILIAEGADVQAKNIYNNTALMNAVRSGQTDVVELLLREGADINARAKNGQTALKLASDSLRKDVAAVLTDYGAMQQ